MKLIWNYQKWLPQQMWQCLWRPRQSPLSWVRRLVCWYSEILKFTQKQLECQVWNWQKSSQLANNNLSETAASLVSKKICLGSSKSIKQNPLCKNYSLARPISRYWLGRPGCQGLHGCWVSEGCWDRPVTERENQPPVSLSHNRQQALETARILQIIFSIVKFVGLGAVIIKTS